VLLLGHAVAHHHGIAAAGILALCVSGAALAGLLGEARRSSAPA
jgi:hypothetical protein